MPKLKISLAVACLTFAPLPAGAALFDRGGGLIYDDVLDVTWLQDAVYQVTTNAPNVDANGKMTWLDAAINHVLFRIGFPAVRELVVTAVHDLYTQIRCLLICSKILKDSAR